MKYSDKQRVQKICEYAKKLLTHISENSITKDKLLGDYSLQWLVTTPLYNIGEQVYALSDEYKATNWNIIADVVFDELPILLKQLELLV